MKIQIFDAEGESLHKETKLTTGIRISWSNESFTLTEEGFIGGAHTLYEDEYENCVLVMGCAEIGLSFKKNILKLSISRSWGTQKRCFMVRLV